MGRKRARVFTFPVLFLFIGVLVGGLVLSSFTRKKKDCRECRFETRLYRWDLGEIDFSIERLENLRMRYRAQMLWHLNQGSRLQFKDGFFLEARKNFQEAELEKQQVDMIERRIRFLQRRRSNLVSGNK